MNTVNRQLLPDVLKGIAVLFMIQVHIIELFASPHIYESFFGKISLFLGAGPVAPIFMIVFGYFVARSRKTSISLAHRGLIILLLGFVLNIALNLNLIISVVFKRIDIPLLPYIFGVDILHLAGLSLIVMAFFKKILIKNVVSVILLIIGISFLGHFLSFKPQNTQLQYIFSFIYGASYWSYFPLLPWLAYPLTGFGIYILHEQQKIRIPLDFAKLLIAICTMFLFIVLTWHFSSIITSDLPLYYHHGLVFYIWTIVFLSLYCYVLLGLLSFFKMNRLTHFLIWNGKNVTMIYFVQWIIIGNIATEIYQSIGYKSHIIFAFIGILIITSLIVYGFTKIKRLWVL